MVQDSSVMIRAVVRSLRPRQWIKNLLVLAVPLAAGRLFEKSILQDVGLAFFSFLFASWFVYLINDVRDRKLDALHPIKARRPIASGLLSADIAVLIATVACAASLILPIVFRSWALLITVGSYVVIQIAYQLGLKHVLLIDVAIIASGFILRAVAGGTATELPISNWFLTVTASVALFVVVAKRSSEFQNQNGSGSTRKVLALYSASYLRLVWSSSMLSSIVFYSLWSVEIGAKLENLYAQFSVIPFSLIIFKYAHHADTGDAESPEHVVFKDRTIQILVVIWLSLFVAQVY